MARQGTTKFLFLRKRSKSASRPETSFSISEVDLQAKKIEIDGENGIEREVMDFRPTHVVIESIWVSPEKFALLTHMHPDIVWIVRVQPESASIVGYGMGKEWLMEYRKYKNVYVKLCV
jgi:hypothetical protein